MPVSNLSGNRLPHLPDKKLPDKLPPLILDNNPEDEQKEKPNPPDTEPPLKTEYVKGCDGIVRKEVAI